MYTILSENGKWYVYYCDGDNCVKEQISGPFDSYELARVNFDSMVNKHTPQRYYEEIYE